MEEWQPTFNLRFIRRVIWLDAFTKKEVRILQQEFVSEAIPIWKSEWRDVPEVSDE